MRLVVGSLTRMFGGEDPEARERIGAGVRRWREDLNEALMPRLHAALEWDEDQEEGWSVDLAEVTHRALLLLAAHAQKPEHAWPDDVPPTVDTDPAWQEISADDYARCHYPQVVIPGMWLPGDYALTMKHVLPDGEEVVLGFLDGLSTQLRQLNQNTLQLSKAAMLEPSAAGSPVGDTFLDQASYGLSAFMRAAEEARRLVLPVAIA